MTTPIPVPPYVPLLSHAIQIDSETPIKTFSNWARTHGEIYEIYLFSMSRSSFSNVQLIALVFKDKSWVWVNSAALCADVSNDQKFSKSIGGPLVEIRALVGDGLFTVGYTISIRPIS